MGISRIAVGAHDARHQGALQTNGARRCLVNRSAISDHGDLQRRLRTTREDAVGRISLSRIRVCRTITVDFLLKCDRYLQSVSGRVWASGEQGVLSASDYSA